MKYHWGQLEVAAKRRVSDVFRNKRVERDCSLGAEPGIGTLVDSASEWGNRFSVA